MPPPRSNLTSSFSVTDANNEVVCPLRNQDGSSCRKRCLGEKRYRSMQEHIRRAHPEHYISKLPATEESFQLMINTPPSERPPPQPTSHAHPQQRGAPTSNPHSTNSGHRYGPIKTETDSFEGYQHERNHYSDNSGPGTPRQLDEYAGGNMLAPAGAASAAQALASLHNHNIEREEWDSEPVRLPLPGRKLDSLPARLNALGKRKREAKDKQDWHSDTEPHTKGLGTSIELPPLRRTNPTSDPYNPLNDRPRNHLSALLNSPPGRSSTLPPIQRHPPGSRPRKGSISKREGKGRSRESQLQAHMRRMSYDRKAFSAEPSAQYGKRWEDLIDAATSATEDVNDDRTPMPQSPRLPHSPGSINRSSMPPFQPSHFHGYQNSPLQQALTPPSIPPYPSVEGADPARQGELSLSDSSPTTSSDVKIYCAACQGISRLKESYACTECICGLCQQCVDVLMAEQGARRRCPRCATVGGKFRPFQVDVR